MFKSIQLFIVYLSITANLSHWWIYLTTCSQSCARLISRKNLSIFKSALECAVIVATNVLSQYSITMKHELFNLIIKLQFMELWKSLHMAILTSLQLVTPAASYNTWTIENDSLVNYWPQQSF
jgi:hypothetical protein